MWTVAIRRREEIRRWFLLEKTGQKHLFQCKDVWGYRSCCRIKDVDAVIISTPDHWHAQPAIEAILGQKGHLSANSPHWPWRGAFIERHRASAGRHLKSAPNNDHHPQFRIQPELVRNGRIGKIHTVRIGLPGDPQGEIRKKCLFPEIWITIWLGSTPEVYYTEDQVHRQQGYGRPVGCVANNLAGMITSWGQHHIDSATGVWIRNIQGLFPCRRWAEFPKWGLWDVHGDFMVKAEYENGITMYISGGYPNGIRCEGNRLDLRISGGSYVASSSDPVTQSKNAKALDASDPKILTSEIKENEIHLYQSDNQHGNWLDCIQSRKEPISRWNRPTRACTRFAW